MDEELKALARHALLNAFYLDYSTLVNKYVEAAHGVDDDEYFEEDLHRNSNPYARCEEADTLDVDMNIYAAGDCAPGTAMFSRWAFGYDSVVEALQHQGAEEVWLRGQKIFEKRDGEWHYLGGGE